MARKRYNPEEIVAKLRQVDVLVSQGQNMVDAIRQIGMSEVTRIRDCHTLPSPPGVASATSLDGACRGCERCQRTLPIGEQSVANDARTGRIDPQIELFHVR